MYVVVLVKGRGAGQHLGVLCGRHLLMADHSCGLFVAAHGAARVRPRSGVRGAVMIGWRTLQLLLVLVLWHVVVLAILLVLLVLMLVKAGHQGHLSRLLAAVESVSWSLAHIVIIARRGHH